MLSNRSFKVFALITKICQYFGAAPFSANLNTRRIYITKEASNAQRSRFRNHLVFLAHVLIQTVFLRFYTEDVTMINFCLTALLPLTVVTLIWLPSALFGNDFVYFFNSLLLVTEQYQGKMSILKIFYLRGFTKIIDVSFLPIIPVQIKCLHSKLIQLKR